MGHKIIITTGYWAYDFGSTLNSYNAKLKLLLYFLNILVITEYFFRYKIYVFIIALILIKILVHISSKMKKT